MKMPFKLVAIPKGKEQGSYNFIFDDRYCIGIVDRIWAEQIQECLTEMDFPLSPEKVVGMVEISEKEVFHILYEYLNTHGYNLLSMEAKAELAKHIVSNKSKILGVKK